VPGQREASDGGQLVDPLIAGCWAVDRENGKRMGVLIWEDAGAPGAVMPGVSARIKAQREAAGRGTQPGPDRTGCYEVVAEV
jgi:hypothetical protein